MHCYFFCFQSKECRRQKQLAKAKSWEAEFARKCQPVKPVKIGCVWLRRNGSSSSGEAEVSKQEQELLRKFAAVALSKLPIAMATPTLVSSSPASASKREEIGGKYMCMCIGVFAAQNTCTHMTCTHEQHNTHKHTCTHAFIILMYPPLFLFQLAESQQPIYKKNKMPVPEEGMQ